MKKTIFAVLCALFLTGCFANVHQEAPAEQIPELMSPGSIFSPGGYIEFENLVIAYDGDSFSVKNNREDIVLVSVMVVGVKADGEYDLIQTAAFSGTDETQYQKDLDENGWAISRATNMVRPGETLDAKLYVFDFGDEYPSPDIDNDGYYDIVFCVHPQDNEDIIQASTSDPVSEVYKIKAE